jgi:hypothetical protein
MGFAAPKEPIPMHPTREWLASHRPELLPKPPRRSRLERLELDVCDLDATLARELAQPWRLKASWFEGRLNTDGKYRPPPDYVMVK